MKPGATLTDVGSSRQSVIANIAPYLREDISYIPAHPMAGTEFSGPEAGFATLFENRWCLITPTSQSKKPDVDRLVTFWQALGAKTRMMEASEHDRICAIVSHLPHLIAFTICDTADKMSETYRTAVLDYAASGFKDFTRIAGSDPVMWRDIFLSNKGAILETLARFQDDVEDLARAIRDDDESRIIDAIERGRRIRKSLVDREQAQDPAHLTPTTTRIGASGHVVRPASRPTRPICASAECRCGESRKRRGPGRPLMSRARESDSDDAQSVGRAHRAEGKAHQEDQFITLLGVTL